MSKTKELPTFSDPSLQKAVKELSPKIDSYHSGLDKISADIKALETHLQNNGIALDVTKYLGTYLEKRIYLRWAHWTITDTYRLLVDFHEETERELEFGEHEWKLTDQKPLIECPASVRVEAVKGLPELVDKIKKGIAEMGEPKV